MEIYERERTEKRHYIFCSERFKENGKWKTRSLSVRVKLDSNESLETLKTKLEKFLKGEISEKNENRNDEKIEGPGRDNQLDEIKF